jgi:hypothetical protein
MRSKQGKKQEKNSLLFFCSNTLKFAALETAPFRAVDMASQNRRRRRRRRSNTGEGGGGAEKRKEELRRSVWRWPSPPSSPHGLFHP